MTLRIPLKLERLARERAHELSEAAGGQTPPLTAVAASARVLLVDDHAIVRDGIARVLQEQADMRVIGQASDGEQAVQQVRELQPDVVVIHTDDGQTVLAHFPEAESVYMLAKVNRWGMVALPMRCRDEDGLWETVLPEGVSGAPLAFFVRRRGDIAGCICRQDCAAA